MTHDLQRFKDAQQYDYDIALSEIQSGDKRSHWMWYIFPQIHGLGNSEISRYYSIQSLKEAQAYISDALLGKRLLEISEALLKLETSDPHEVFGSPDDLKLLSCMTLFEIADPDTDIFGKIIQKYYNGHRDQRTLEVLRNE